MTVSARRGHSHNPRRSRPLRDWRPPLLPSPDLLELDRSRKTTTTSTNMLGSPATVEFRARDYVAEGAAAALPRTPATLHPLAAAPPPQVRISNSQFWLWISIDDPFLVENFWIPCFGCRVVLLVLMLMGFWSTTTR